MDVKDRKGKKRKSPKVDECDEETLGKALSAACDEEFFEEVFGSSKEKELTEGEKEEDFGSADSTILLDLFNDIMDLESELAQGDPTSYAEECGRSKTVCANSLKAVRKLVQDSSPPYELIEIQFDRHKTPKADKLHFIQRPEVIDDHSQSLATTKKLFIRTGAYPFTSGSITDSTLVDAMAKIARVLNHNWIFMDDFEFTSFAIHGTYSDHRENAWVSIKGCRKHVPSEASE